MRTHLQHLQRRIRSSEDSWCGRARGVLRRVQMRFAGLAGGPRVQREKSSFVDPRIVRVQSGTTSASIPGRKGREPIGPSHERDRERTRSGGMQSFMGSASKDYLVRGKCRSICALHDFGDKVATILPRGTTSIRRSEKSYRSSHTWNEALRKDRLLRRTSHFYQR